MVDIAALISNVVSLANTAAIITHQSQLASTTTVAKAGLDLVKEVRETYDLDADQVAALETSREQFEAAVNAHADRTAASLG